MKRYVDSGEKRQILLRCLLIEKDITVHNGYVTL